MRSTPAGHRSSPQAWPRRLDTVHPRSSAHSRAFSTSFFGCRSLVGKPKPGVADCQRRYYPIRSVETPARPRPAPQRSLDSLDHRMRRTSAMCRHTPPPPIQLRNPTFLSVDDGKLSAHPGASTVRHAAQRDGKPLAASARSVRGCLESGDRGGIDVPARRSERPKCDAVGAGDRRAVGPTPVANV